MFDVFRVRSRLLPRTCWSSRDKWKRSVIVSISSSLYFLCVCVCVCLLGAKVTLSFCEFSLISILFYLYLKTSQRLKEVEQLQSQVIHSRSCIHTHTLTHSHTHTLKFTNSLFLTFPHIFSFDTLSHAFIPIL